MLISFGKGGDSAQRAVDYMLQAEDHKGKPRESVTVLRGEPQPIGKEIDQVLDDFERLAFAGVDRSQYSWSAIEHGEADGGKHIHFIIVRTDRALNVD